MRSTPDRAGACPLPPAPESNWRQQFAREVRKQELTDREKRELRKAKHERNARLVRLGEDVGSEAASVRPQRRSHDPRLDVTPLEPGQKRRTRAVDPHWSFRPSGTREREGGR